MKNASLTLPEPCHESWNSMSPKEKGRFCDKCCKVVTDFTAMATDDVIRFIQERGSEKICGRFRSDQISVPPSFPEKNRSTTAQIKIFLAALVLVFGSALFTGCQPEDTAGEPVIHDTLRKTDSVSDTTAMQKTVPVDSVESKLQGQVKCESSNGEPTIGDNRPEYMLGGPAMRVKDEPPVENIDEPIFYPGHDDPMGAPVLLPEPPDTPR